MLSPSSQEASIVVCETCRFSVERQADPLGRRGGALMADALRMAALARGGTILVESMPCLFACARFCTVHLRAPGKMTYVLGDFAPGREAADAILDFFEHYLDSEHGMVDYRLWPDGIKGHFITRSPPIGWIAGDG
ncbi:MAG: DUF1636 domain-containing protein [Alphaproteobacteria bacterium]